SKVSATTRRLRAPLLTTAGPLGTHPTSCGVWRLASAGLAGNMLQQPIRLGLGGVQAGGRKVLSTCQRIERKAMPKLVGLKVAVSVRAPARVTVASTETALPGPLRLIF